MKTWRISDATPTVGLKRWQEGLADAFVRLDAETHGADLFAGSIEQAKLSTGQVSRVTASAHRVVRRAEHVRQRRRDITFVNLQLSGSAEVAMTAGTFTSRPFDLCVVPTGDPYSISHGTDFELLCVAIDQQDLPKGLRPGILRLSQSVAGREIAGVLNGLGALAVRLPEVRAAIEQQIHTTLSMACTVAAAPSDADALREAICAYIARTHGNPGLSAGPIAASFGMSERQLHALFAHTGQTVGARIEEARFRTALELLRDPTLPVSQVALRAGFRDPGYFGRVFRRRHAVSPRDWRAARLS